MKSVIRVRSYRDFQETAMEMGLDRASCLYIDYPEKLAGITPAINKVLFVCNNIPDCELLIRGFLPEVEE